MSNILRKKWRDASTVIVLAKQNQKALPRKSGSVNYDILVQTRPQSASFANSVVFPGGVSEPVDSSSEWLQLIKSFGFSQEQFDALHHQADLVSPIFANNPVLRHVSLRITAIRETFEELGVLLCSRLSNDKRLGHWATCLTDFEVALWQTRVRSNPEELLNLCQELKCYPDIWSLYYWSNWLTPHTYKKRFDTAFFITALKDKPNTVRDKKEVVKVQWASPDDILQRNHKGELVLFPPQSYELYRLTHMKDIEDLIQFAADRSKYDGPLFYPVRIDAKDGFIHVLPGDDLYPSDLKDYDDNRISRIEDTVLQLREDSVTLHRFEYATSRKEFITRNLNPKHHISMDETTLQVNSI